MAEFVPSMDINFVLNTMLENIGNYLQEKGIDSKMCEFSNC